ncbi:bifunctional (2E,6E)-farnesyl diphosphate synthase/dimethylallyltranstransferase [Sugiyamaella lignohabitans]|uniref:Bifunctional (2E,6E)-farnesyl diphosphate synthase/dimethylallyltranstransferase n=1 Tax=Sugiyamaella lignohabitans TaxID=796027 RepID=A0A161HGJ7_9ASCO|nr:bifunctional (2E,6E)-farnesyl diphosphate synthase/dimethylallyltranstransferase [Sugiyamaella lignohabitans]ANB14890.1 bifunctional (2E,6E)-farnesyl diphosphate synthase/dimethylallyltranstransferase [Sugiyamaella lignohabitans]
MSEAKQKFESIFPALVDELLEVVSETKISQDAIDWIKQNLIYNTLGGKANRGLSVIDTYKLLSGKKELSDAEYKRAAVLGWCVELLQAFFLVADDIMDASKTRRGQPCWYLQVS